jgi:PiT family inorganic phosphate transporter
MSGLLLLAVCFLAYSNGANDNFKGVASLYGGKATSYRTAIAWATVATFAGSAAAIYLAQSLLLRFSGKGLAPDALAGSAPFLLAVAVGAGLTVILATFLGFPISTTHALTGAMAGGGWAAVGTQVDLSVLGRAFFQPLLLSPLLAIALGAALYWAFGRLRLRLGIAKEWCVCVGAERRILADPEPSPELAWREAAPALSAHIGARQDCERRYAGRFFGVDCQRAVDAAHFLSAGVVSFARGLNDTPKMAALLPATSGLDAAWGLLAVGVAIALGGLLNARRVAETLSHKIAGMNRGQGFSANLAAGLLVISASLYGLPVSTTHVTVGALFGIGLTNGQANFKTMRNILWSWLITLPCAAFVGAAVYRLTRL